MPPSHEDGRVGPVYATENLRERSDNTNIASLARNIGKRGEGRARNGSGNKTGDKGS
jgi:hypothetical protein